jgi:hypothetical protein
MIEYITIGILANFLFFVISTIYGFLFFSSMDRVEFMKLAQYINSSANAMRAQTMITKLAYYVSYFIPFYGVYYSIVNILILSRTSKNAHSVMDASEEIVSYHIINIRRGIKYK